MRLGADMVGDQPDDAFSLQRAHLLIRLGYAAIEMIDPEPAIGVEHDFGDIGVIEPGGDRRAERAPQHRSTACMDNGRRLSHERLSPSMDRRVCGVGDR